MSESSKIEWCDHTFNPWEGCQKFGPGCDNCYTEARNARFGGGTAPHWGPGALRRRASAANWRKPLAWNRDAGVFYAQHRPRQRVFCASLADVFYNEVDPQWRADLFTLIKQTPNLDWLLLTKRIGNVGAMIQDISDRMFGSDALGPARLPDNVWLGATIVNQEEANRDIPSCSRCRPPSGS
jgi:protein gp37